MRFFAMLMFAIVLTSSGLLLAETPAGTAAANDNFPAQLQTLADQTQSQIAALEQQLTDADNVRRDDLQRQIVELKKQGEIRRLEILLNWAQSKGDNARVVEIQRALENWTNPPQSSGSPVIVTPQDKAALSGPSAPANTNPTSK